MDNTALKIDDVASDLPVSPDPGILETPGAGEDLPTQEGPPGPSLEIPPPPKRKKRGGKRPGAGRPKKSKAKSPFTGKTDPPKEEGKAPDSIEVGAFADMNHVAAVATHAFDGMIVGVASMRYGGDKAADLHANKKALADIQAAVLVYLEHSAIRITPLQAVLIALGAVYGPPVMALEMERSQEKRKKKEVIK